MAESFSQRELLRDNKVEPLDDGFQTPAELHEADRHRFLFNKWPFSPFIFIFFVSYPIPG